MPVPAKLVNVPPVNVTSSSAKSVAAWLSVKVKSAVSPALTLALSADTAMAGLTELTVMVWLLLVSDPSVLKLPARSENLLLATLTTPLVVLSAVGVNVAV